jgi:hypothetical protein
MMVGLLIRFIKNKCKSTQGARAQKRSKNALALFTFAPCAFVLLRYSFPIKKQQGTNGIIIKKT